MGNFYHNAVANNVLTLQDVAGMLKVCPRTVLNMANRGDIPASRIGHLWRFDENEILAWLKAKNEMRPPRKNILVGGELPEFIMELVTPELIRIEKTVVDKRQALEDLAALAVRTELALDYSTLLRSIEEREEMFPTAMDEGIAFPHPRRPLKGLEDPLLSVLVVKSGVSFGAPGGGKTYIFILFCAPDDSAHVRLLARLARIFHNQRRLISKLKNIQNPETILGELISAERERAFEMEMTISK